MSRARTASKFVILIRRKIISSNEQKLHSVGPGQPKNKKKYF